MKRPLFLLPEISLSVLLSLSLSVDALGEGDSNACGVCFKGKSIERCCNYFIFESGYKTLISGSNRDLGKSGFLFTADLGLMRNLNTIHAIGASVYLAADDDGTRNGLRLRYRRWLGKHATLDVSAGPILAGSSDLRVARWPGFVASVSVGSAGWFSVDAHLEALRFAGPVYDPVSLDYVNEDVTDVSLYLGVSGRAYMAFVTPIVVIALIAITFDSPNPGFGP